MKAPKIFLQDEMERRNMPSFISPPWPHSQAQQVSLTLPQDPLISHVDPLVQYSHPQIEPLTLRTSTTPHHDDERETKYSRSGIGSKMPNDLDNL